MLGKKIFLVISLVSSIDYCVFGIEESPVTTSMDYQPKVEVPAEAEGTEVEQPQKVTSTTGEMIKGDDVVADKPEPQKKPFFNADEIENLVETLTNVQQNSVQTVKSSVEKIRELLERHIKPIKSDFMEAVNTIDANSVVKHFSSENISDNVYGIIRNFESAIITGVNAISDLNFMEKFLDLLHSTVDVTAKIKSIENIKIESLPGKSVSKIQEFTALSDSFGRMKKKIIQLMESMFIAASGVVGGIQHSFPANVQQLTQDLIF